MWRRVGPIAVILVLGACGSAPPAPESPTPSPEPDPSAMPTSVAADLSPSAIPPEDLVPAGADVTGEWFAITERGVMVLIAWVEPGADPFRLPRGFAVWRRYEATPHWRSDLVEWHGPEDEIQQIQVTTADVTGDGSDDALVFRGTGGSGACGHWSTIDLARLKETYRRDLCDGHLEPGPPGSPGLVLTESVYRQGDAHCCPSAIRTTTLTWAGGAWRVTDKSLVET
jgi:hypothetical protein